MSTPATETECSALVQYHYCKRGQKPNCVEFCLVKFYQIQIKGDAFF